jgi:hypothetical protein
VCFIFTNDIEGLGSHGNSKAAQKCVQRFVKGIIGKPNLYLQFVPRCDPKCERMFLRGHGEEHQPDGQSMTSHLVKSSKEFSSGNSSEMTGTRFSSVGSKKSLLLVLAKPGHS